MPTADAVEGTTLSVPVHNKDTVGPKCTSTTDGHWFCITHDQGFGNNLQMQGHTDRGEHTLAWICHTHGPEVP
jgi:hypothetical protein